MFFWKNPSGIEPHELSDERIGTPEPSFREGLATYTADLYRYRWTVGVVPSAVFPHLKCPVFHRHNLDDEGEPKEYYSTYDGLAY